MKRASKSRILVVDDEPLNRRLIQAILAPDGYDLVQAMTGDAALEIIGGGGVDLVLLDVMMPGLDGIEVCRRIRVELGQPLLPIVVISALSDASSRTRAKAAGADDFLTKPIHEDELLVRVRNLLLVRRYYAFVETERARAELEARRWRLVSGVAAAVSGCLDYQSLVHAIGGYLMAQLDVDATAFLEVGDNDNHDLVAISPASWPDRMRNALTALSAGSAPNAVTRLDLGDVGLLAVSISSGGARWTFCFVRGLAFSPEELALFDDMRPHMACAVAAVHSHDQTLAALRASEERHRILFDASPLPIWVFDPKTLAILGANDALAKATGYARDELCTLRMPDLRHPEDVPRLIAGMAHASEGHTHRVGVLRYLCKDRRTIELDITAHATRLDGRLAILAVGIDVTASRRVEQQLRQSQKMDAIGQLAGGVAHDFNNILGAIMGCTEIVMEELGDDHPAMRDLMEIDAAAHRAAKLTRQLLAFSRQQPRATRVVDLNFVVTDVEKMLARIVGEDIDMSAVLAPELDSIEADTGQLEQVLMNLVVNARDAMPNGGRLVIGTANEHLDATQAQLLGVRAGRFVALSVSDTGGGMDDATQARIFEPFFTTKEVGKGTGLGLSTVFGIVKQSNGAISVRSEPGQGTTFRVYFPHVVAADEQPQLQPKRPPPVSGGARRILLVEDDDQLRAVVGRQLTAWGYTLVEARDAAAALDALARLDAPVDLLLTDLVMPGTDGRTLATEVIARRPSAKVLFMSGYTEHAAVKTALGSNDLFIEKPFTSVNLSAAIRRALDA